MPTRSVLVTPGPVPAPPEVLSILAQPMEHHRTPAFVECLARSLAGLKRVFKTERPAFIHASTGSGGMEAAIVNVLSPGDECIAVVSGKFGERWADMAAAYGARVSRIDVEWGKSVEPAQVREALRRTPNAHAVLCQACETSTGALHPVRAIAREVAATDALFLVDGITAVGAIEMPMDEWQLDVVVAGSQKAFMLPTGCAFTSFSEKAWRRVETARSPRFYFDVRKELAANRAGETYFSSPVSLIRALDWILANPMGDGGARVRARIENLARATRAGARELGLAQFPEHPSPSLTALRLPAGMDGQKLRADMEREHGVVAMGGQDALKGKIVRIGHMGAISDDDVESSLRALGAAAGFEINKIDRAVEAAANELA